MNNVAEASVLCSKAPSHDTDHTTERKKCTQTHTQASTTAAVIIISRLNHRFYRSFTCTHMFNNSLSRGAASSSVTSILRPTSIKNAMPSGTKPASFAASHVRNTTLGQNFSLVPLLDHAILPFSKSPMTFRSCLSLLCARLLFHAKSKWKEKVRQKKIGQKCQPTTVLTPLFHYVRKKCHNKRSPLFRAACSVCALSCLSDVSIMELPCGFVCSSGDDGIPYRNTWSTRLAR